MGEQRKLFKRTLIYGIGNIGSKILSYIMVLVYSYYIKTEDMGIYDLALTTVAMVQPLIIFQINDGVYRYLIDSKVKNKSLVLSTSITFILVTCFVAETIILSINFFVNIDYCFLIMAYLFSFILFAFLQDSIRGLSRSRIYAESGIVNSFVTLVIEIVGLIILRRGVEILFIAKIIANFVGLLYLYLKTPELRSGLSIKCDKKILLELIDYSAPLVPNTIGWWIVNSSDRYIILFFLGTSFNGIYSMTNKFPTVLTTLTSIFYLAWQESAIKEYNTSHRDEFFSDIFEKYYKLLFSLSLLAIPATRFVIQYFVAMDYQDAWRYAGFLFGGAVFSALSSFLGLGYQISKETKRSMVSTLIAAGINMAVNIALIKIIGLHAASFSTFISYFVLFIVRIKHTKRYYTLKVNWYYFWGLFTALIAITFLVLIIDNMIYIVISIVLGVVIAIIINKDIMIKIVSVVKTKR